MILRRITTDELPTRFVITKHAFTQAHLRVRKTLKNKNVDLYLGEVAVNGDFYQLPTITKDGVAYAKQKNGVVVFVQVAMNEDGTLEDVGFVTSVGTPGGKNG